MIRRLELVGINLTTFSAYIGHLHYRSACGWGIAKSNSAFQSVKYVHLSLFIGQLCRERRSNQKRLAFFILRMYLSIAKLPYHTGSQMSKYERKVPYNMKC